MVRKWSTVPISLSYITLTERSMGPGWRSRQEPHLAEGSVARCARTMDVLAVPVGPTCNSPPKWRRMVNDWDNTVPLGWSRLYCCP
jgi:hypothetical protein